MDERSFESLKEEVIGEPLVGLLFGESIAVAVIPLDYSPVLTAIPSLKRFVSPEDTITDWWMEVISAANKRRQKNG